ncbi:MAG TPA: hypothetical protein VN898_04890 [Candidatus Binatia bacterium]|nr:hypothetical protein [Candidatus Binatia bacterium]
MKVLRDELVARDRQLRRAQAESTVLRAELDQMKAKVAAAQAAMSPSSLPTPPVSASREVMPSNRVPLYAFRDP